MLRKLMSDGSRRSFFQVATGLGLGIANWPALARVAADEARSELGPTAPPTSAVDGNSAAPSQFSKIASEEIVEAVDYSLRTIMTEPFDALFPRPFEVERLKRDALLRDQVRRLAIGYLLGFVGRSDSDGSIHMMFVPKPSMHGYRRGAHIELLEYVRYLSCAVLIGKSLEPARVPAKALRVFSYRFKPHDKYLFDDRYDFQSFHDHLLSRLDDVRRTYLVSADIADFYPSVDNDRLSQALLRCGAQPWIIKALNDLLDRWGKGLPIGSQASRILAEAALLDVDASLGKDGIDFIRFVDDYRLFAPDITTARRWLERLIEHLAGEHFNLNYAKTFICLTSRTEYQALVATRRAAKLWGSLSLKAARIELVQETPQPKKKKEKKKKKPPYEATSPFEKSDLNEDDIALLERCDPAGLLVQLKEGAETRGHIRLGDFRLFIEASLHRGDYALFFKGFDFVNYCPHCIPYLVNVLIAASEQIPNTIREMATAWFAARLTSNACTTDYEVLQVAQLLGTKEYECTQAVYSYFLSTGHASSPIAARALLSALREHCDQVRAASLVDLCEHTDPFTRRALLDLVWPQLDKERRSIVLKRHHREFDRDPFLAALIRDA
jgi:Reverse transcriptase (RNA-dependent DNA polymerase)